MEMSRTGESKETVHKHTRPGDKKERDDTRDRETGQGSTRQSVTKVPCLPKLREFSWPAEYAPTTKYSPLCSGSLLFGNCPCSRWPKRASHETRFPNTAASFASRVSQGKFRYPSYHSTRFKLLEQCHCFVFKCDLLAIQDDSITEKNPECAKRGSCFTLTTILIKKTRSTQ